MLCNVWLLTTNVEPRQIRMYYPITKNTTAVFVVYKLQIHLPRWFSPTKKTVLLRLQYHDYFYHSHNKSTTAVIVVLYLYHIS